MNNEINKTKLTLQIGECKTSWEIPYNDCTATDILQGLAGLMMTHTFLPCTVYSTMKELAEEHLDDEVS